MTNVQKNDILQLIETEKQRLGSYAAVAKKCGISETSLSQLRSGKYAAQGDDIYDTIALALGYEFDDSNWVICEDTTNFRLVTEVLRDAKEESMFMGISHKAGAGKTSASDVFLAQNKMRGTFKISCKEWNGTKFLRNIAREIGADVSDGYVTTGEIIESISEAFKKKAHTKPVLIVDQANSLKPAALRTLIHLYNECEDILGLVVLGTENLEVEIKRGVRYNKPGYDELDSRFGRKYIHLIGSTLLDARKICEVNGVKDKELQKRIFEQCEPTRVTLSDGKSIEVVEDMRRLKRIVKRERLKMKYA